MMLAVISPMSQLPKTYFNGPDAAAAAFSYSFSSCGLASTALPQHTSYAKATPPTKRPRLTLNTSVASERVFGKASTSLRVDALTATTPTARNTLKNAYDSLATIISANATSPPPSFPATCLENDVTGATPPSPSSSASTSPALSHARTGQSGVASSASSSSISSFEYPEIKKLQNSTSAFQPVTSRKSFESDLKPISSIMSAFASSRSALTGAVKHVSFRDPLDEEIRTFKYTLAHSDIFAEDAALALTCPDRNGGMVEQHPSAGNQRIASTQLSTMRPHSSIADASSAHRSALEKLSDRSSATINSLKRESDDSETDSDFYAQTPASGRRKRRREWVWTLEPLNKTNDETNSSEIGSPSSI